MTACIRCSYDPDARVAASWTFAIDKEVKSLNDSARMIGGGKWAYAKNARTRNDWASWMTARRISNGIPLATSKRRVTIERIIGYRQREFDADNLSGGCKSLVDAMVLAGLLVGDRRDQAEIHYAQVKRDGARGVRITIEELS